MNRVFEQKPPEISEVDDPADCILSEPRLLKGYGGRAVIEQQPMWQDEAYDALGCDMFGCFPHEGGGYLHIGKNLVVLHAPGSGRSVLRCQAPPRGIADNQVDGKRKVRIFGEEIRTADIIVGR